MKREKEEKEGLWKRLELEGMVFATFVGVIDYFEFALLLCLCKEVCHGKFSCQCCEKKF